MPKHKQFLEKPKKKSKHAAPVPTTADEYLAAGVDFEEAGEKWRGGDAVKSTRFFMRALDAYEEGLKKFSQSFDLAYNKARLQYEITEHPKLLKQIPEPLLALLQTALDSSRYALSLRPEDADALFNTAQLLTKFSEEEDFKEKKVCLEEALWLFEICLRTQWERLRSSVFEDHETAEAGGQDVEMEYATASASVTTPGSSTNTPAAAQQKTAWALVVEPMTDDTILDTIVAQLQTLSKLAEEVSPMDNKSAEYVLDYYKDTMRRYLREITPSAARENELKLAKANYKCAQAFMQYQQNDKKTMIPLDEYEAVIMNAYTTFDISTSPQALCDYGDSLIAFATTVKNLGINCDPYLTQRWSALDKAQKAFAAALKLKDVEHQDQIYLMKGDVDMLRFQLGEEEHYSTAVKYKEMLLDNAYRFYNRAVEFLEGSKAPADRESEYRESEGQMKVFLVEAFQGNPETLVDVWDNRDAKVIEAVIREAISDGLVSGKQLAGFGLSGF